MSLADSVCLVYNAALMVKKTPVIADYGLSLSHYEVFVSVQFVTKFDYSFVEKYYFGEIVEFVK